MKQKTKLLVVNIILLLLQKVINPVLEKFLKEEEELQAKENAVDKSVLDQEF